MRILGWVGASIAIALGIVLVQSARVGGSLEQALTPPGRRS
jgi:hypothetical protein